MSGHISFAFHSSPDHHEARARAVAHGLLPATVFALLALAGNGLAGCAKSEVVSAGGANGGATGGAAGQGTSGAGGTIQLTIDTTPTVTRSSVDAEVTSQMVGCDGGDGCTCPPLNVAVLGKPGKWGANPNGDPDTALQDWLNSSSAGTARVDNFTNRVTLTSDFLATYNVIILASLSDDSNLGPFWTFDPSEVAAFQDVLVYGDEWITYTTQWNGVGNPETNDPACAGFLPQDVYQTAQFWYNMIKWSQPSAACFEIVDEQQPVVIW